MVFPSRAGCTRPTFALLAVNKRDESRLPSLSVQSKTGGLATAGFWLRRYGRLFRPDRTVFDHVLLPNTSQLMDHVMAPRMFGYSATGR
jgi:hypothetical protein